MRERASFEEAHTDPLDLKGIECLMCFHPDEMLCEVICSVLINTVVYEDPTFEICQPEGCQMDIQVGLISLSTPRHRSKSKSELNGRWCSDS